MALSILIGMEIRPEISRIIYQAGLDGELQRMDASLMASASDIVRRLSSQTSTLGPETLLNDLSGIILNTLGHSLSDSIIRNYKTSLPGEKTCGIRYARTVK